MANEPWPSHRGTLWSSWGWTSRRPWSSTTSRCTSAATIDLVTGNVLAALEPGGWFVISDFPFPDTEEGLRSVPGQVMHALTWARRLLP